MEKTRVLNIDALAITERQLLEGLDRNIDGSDSGMDSTGSPTNGVLITPNLDHLVKLQKDEEFYRCYQQAQWVVCDSKILWLCSKVLKRTFPEPIQGSSFFTHFYLYRAEKDRLLEERPSKSLLRQAQHNACLGGLPAAEDLDGSRAESKDKKALTSSEAPSSPLAANACDSACESFDKAQDKSSSQTASQSSSATLSGDGEAKEKKSFGEKASSVEEEKSQLDDSINHKP